MFGASSDQGRACKAAAVSHALYSLVTEAVAYCASTREIEDKGDAAHAKQAACAARPKAEDAIAAVASALGACEAPFKKILERHQLELIQRYRKNYDLQRRVVGMLLTMGAVPRPSGVAGQPSVYDVRSAERRVKAVLNCPPFKDTEQRRRLVQMMLDICACFSNTDSAVARMRQAADEHVARRDKRCFLAADYVGSDLVTRFVELVDYRSVLPLMRCNREMWFIPEARQRLPHLSVRHCAGCFPHAILPAAGGVCNFVNKKDVVKLYVDFVARGSKLAGEAGPQTKAHSPDAQQDAYRSMPNSTLRLRRELENSMKRRRQAPEEPVGPEAYRVRLPVGAYFDEPIDCSVDLVFADDKKPVTATRHMDTLVFSQRMLSPCAPTATFTSDDGVPYPAHLAFKVTALSCEHGGRPFALRVTGQTRTRPERDAVEMVAYSRPFVVMANAKSSAAYATRPKRAPEGGR